jgi:hypothetical protein
MARGGKRVPQRPAAVSNPQSGQRTDGGPGSKSQPIRVPTGGAYGEAQALESQQQGAPLPTGGLGGAPTARTPNAAPLNQGIDVFGPTKRPYQDPRMGSSAMPTTALARNPQAALRVMYAKFPHPAIQRLLDTSSYGSKPPR